MASTYEAVSRGYDAWAPIYDDATNPMLFLTDKRLRQRPLPSTATHVLELGCGSGRLISAIVANSATTYTGVDASKKMLALAQQRCVSNRVRLI